MQEWFSTPSDWSAIVTPETSLIEIFIRGTAVYLFLFLLLRIVLKRETAGVGITDLLVIVLLADAAQNAMAGNYQSVPDGLLLVGTIVGWAWGLDFLAYRSVRIRHMIQPRPIPLIEDGHLIPENVRRELLTRDEILGQLRRQGIERIEDVERAWMEHNGVISAVAREDSERASRD